MLRKFKKMSKKKKAFLIIAILLVLGILAGILYSAFKPEPPEAYALALVEKGDLQAQLEANGTVESNIKKDFTIPNGTVVKEVFVSVGDEVNPGDKIATFDTSPLNSKLNEYKEAYVKAKAAYDKSIAGVDSAKSQTPAVKKQIAAAEKAIKKLEAEIAAATNAGVQVPAFDFDVTAPTPEQIQEIVAYLLENGLTEEQVNSVIAALRGGAEDVYAALQETEAAKQIQLSQKKMELSTLNTQLSLLQVQSDDTLADMYKSVMQQKKADFDAYSAIIASLNAGWVSEIHGIVTEVNVKAGLPFTSAKASGGADISALLQSVSGNSDVLSTLTDILGTGSKDALAVGTGITVQGYDEFVANFPVSKSELLTLKVGQTATVTSMGKTYDAEVSYVSATAVSSGGFDISSITSSLTGGSGSSAGSGLATVKILNPDKNIVLGFDVDIAVNTETMVEITKIPVDAVITTAEGKTSVFVYNTEDSTVSLREVKLGTFAGNEYELISGLQLGERVVINPKNALTDGAKISVK